MPYLLPASAQYSIQDWDVDKPSPIHWNTPGILMENDNNKYFGFHRFGHVNGWQVRLYGPHAGIEAVQLISAQPTVFKPEAFRAKLAEKHIAYTVQGCNPRGSLLRIIAPGKQPSYLFSGKSGLTLFTFDEMPKPIALNEIGIGHVQNRMCY